MTEFKFNIVGKDGKVIEDLTFDDFDAVADYMLEAADKWYAGLQDPGDQIVFNRIEDGKVVYSDESSFGGSDVGAEIERDIDNAREFISKNNLPRIENIENS